MTTELAEPETTPIEGNATVEPEEFARPQFWSVPGAEEYELHVLMPGVAKDDVSVSLNEDQLTIVGRRAKPVPESWKPHFRETNDLNYRLRVRLNIRVDEEKIEGHMEDGVLRLVLPIHGEAKPRKIKVD
jgi:HSP20 family protein